MDKEIKAEIRDINIFGGFFFQFIQSVRRSEHPEQYSDK